MKLKRLVSDHFEIVAVMDGDECPAEQFLLHGEENTSAARLGLFQMLSFAAGNGLDSLPSGWTHEADKKEKIYEFIKGPLRLFFFKGKNGQIAVCTGGVRKKRRKADKEAVNKASTWRDEYLQAWDKQALEMEKDDETV